MIGNLNPWEMGTALETGPQIPSFTESKYLIVSINPPKNKTVREGLVLTALMVSYVNAEGSEVKTMEVDEDGNGISIKFPEGKRNLMATKYRGPKSIYKFVNPITNKFYQIDNKKFTVEYANDYLAENISDWSGMSEAEKDVLIDQYFEDMYMFGLSNDLALNDKNEDGKVTLPTIGMITEFYRRWSPPKEGETYGNTIITKYAPREGRPNLSGDFMSIGEDIAGLVLDKHRYKEEIGTSDKLPF